MQEYQAGNTQPAFDLLAQARASDPKNLPIPVDHAKLLIVEQRYAEAKAILQNLPPQAHASSMVASLPSHLELIEAAQPDIAVEILEQQIAAAPEDSAARFSLTATLLSHDYYDGALRNLLEPVKCDRGFRDELARRVMIAVFDLLGNHGELVNRYRSLLFLFFEKVRNNFGLPVACLPSSEAIEAGGFLRAAGKPTILN